MMQTRCTFFGRDIEPEIYKQATTAICDARILGIEHALHDATILSTEPARFEDGVAGINDQIELMAVSPSEAISMERIDGAV